MRRLDLSGERVCGRTKSSPPQASRERNPEVTDRGKIIILDTDHLRNNLGSGANMARRAWVWKSFTRGYNPIYMDQLDASPTDFGGANSGNGALTYAHEVHDAMGHTKFFADEMPLADMTPQPELSTTSYALASVGSAYLVYQPEPSRPCRRIHSLFTGEQIPFLLV